MKVNFYIKGEYVDMRGMVPIYIYISVHGKRYKFPTGIKCIPDQWEPPKLDKKTKLKNLGRVRGSDENAREKNRCLQSMETEVERVYTEALRMGATISREYFQKELSFLRKMAGDFFNVWDKYIESGRTQRAWSEGFTKRLNTLKGELDKMNKKSKVDFETINDDFLDRFLKEHFRQGWTNPYTEKNYKLLKGFLNWATRRGYNKNTAYQSFEINLPKPGEDDNIYYLTLDELNRVIGKKIENEKLQRVRDCFLFQCFTGLRYSDLCTLKKTDINTDNIHITTQKTRKAIKIPLNDISRAILKKYVDLPGEKALPVISNQKYNDYLKDLGKLADLNDPVTWINYVGSERVEDSFPKWAKISTHTGRKTFVTLGVFLGIPIETMVKYTGQTLDIVQRYYDIMDEVKEREMKKFDSVLRIVS